MTFSLFHETTAIGDITITPSGPTISYRADWQASPDAFPISLSMPLSGEEWPPEVVAPWLMNLLPEGDPLRAMVRALGIAQEDVLGLIERTGGDLAGALRVGGPRLVDNATYREIGSETDLERIIEELPAKPFLVGDDGVTMSLAGAQQKLPVALIDGQIAIPLNGAPSTHILKPDNPRLAGSVVNEALCMVLAKRCRLPVAAVTSGRAGARRYLLVERYDRQVAQGKVRRLHQEDFCQALGRPPGSKYQHNQTGIPGPSLGEMFAIVRNHMTAVDINRLLDAVIFNISIGNVDSHAKNYSILLGPDGSKLAPLYDLMSGLSWGNITPNHAQSIGGQQRGQHIYGRHWRRMAEACGLSPAATVRRVGEVSARILAGLPAAAAAVEALSTETVMLDVFVQAIRERATVVQAHALQEGPAAPPEAAVHRDSDVTYG
jgi:serine/threonine-protein kinase HipA